MNYFNAFGRLTQLIILLLTASVNSGSAQISISLDRTNAYYEVGDTARFIITNSVGGPVTYRIGYDLVTPEISSGIINTVAGIPVSIPVTQTSPGGVVCWVNQNATENRAQVLFSPYKIAPSEAEPADFDAFWNAQKTSVSQIPLNPQLAFYSTTGRSNTYLLTMDFIDGRKIYGYISVPVGTGTMPAIIHFPPLGSNAGLVHPLEYMSDELGAIVIALSIHNALPDQTDPMAYLPNDATNRNSIYYRYSVLAGLKTIDYLFSRSDFDQQNLALIGESQGGGLSFMVAGLDSRVKLVVNSIMALTEHTAWRYGKASSFPNYLSTANLSSYGNQAYINSTAQAVKYYDAQYFAKRYKGPVLAAISYKDDVSPASTIFSTLNQLSGPQTIIHAIDLYHNHPDEYWLARNEIIRRYLAPTRTPVNNPFPPSKTGYFANAGNDFDAKTNQISSLTGMVEVDLALNSTLPVKWEKIAGPGVVTFGNPNNRTTNVSFSLPGTYVLRFSTIDNALLATKNRYITCSDVVEVTVTEDLTPVCSPKGLEPWWQWIANVKLSNLNNISQKEGFADFSALKADVAQGATYPLNLLPGFAWLAYDEYWRVWIDWNADGDFDDLNELAYQNHGTGALNGTMTVPPNTPLGPKKMRIAMKKDAYANPCEAFQFGEVEEYTVNVQVASPMCNFSVQVSGIQCIDNGTPFLGSDDTWRFSLLASSQNGSTTGWRTTVKGIHYTGSYGVSRTISGLAFTGSVNIKVYDAVDSTCQTTLSIVQPATCVQVAPVCSVSGQVSGIQCVDNGTPYVGSDDTWRFSLLASSQNGSVTGWKTTVKGINYTGSYGVSRTISGLAFTGSVSIKVYDAVDSTCQTTLSIVQPATCVQVAPVCSVSGQVSGIQCVDNGTPFLGSDDTWRFSLLASSQNGSVTGWKTTVKGINYTGSYGVSRTISGLAFTGSVSIKVYDAVDSTCQTTLSIVQPATCVQVAPVCSVSGQVSGIQCVDNGTPFLGSDDTWRFSLLASSQNGSAAGWKTTVKGVNHTGTYGTAKTISSLAFTGSVSIKVYDAADSTCQTTLSIVQPATCVQVAPVCSVNGQVSGIQCIDNGTPYLGSDDTWRFSVLVTSQNGSAAGWKSTVKGMNVTGQYGVQNTFGGLLFGNNVNLKIYDAADSTCQFSTSVLQPATCVQTPPPTTPTYCAIQSDYPWHEWMRAVTFNNVLVNSSGKAPYTDFTAKEIILKVGRNNTFKLSGQFSYLTYSEYWQIWIDYDKDGLFEAPQELVYKGTTSAPTPVIAGALIERSGSFNIQSNAGLGKTRMRIIMSRNPIVNACTNLAFGEIEDYTAVLSPPNNLVSGNSSRVVQTPDPEPNVLVFPNPAKDFIKVDATNYEDKPLTIKVMDILGKQVLENNIAEVSEKFIQVDISNVNNGIYFVQLSSPGSRTLTRRLVVEKTN